MLGIDVVPHLPVEEVLFYPFGGVLCIFIYVYLVSTLKIEFQKSTIFWCFIMMGTLAFVGIAWVTRHFQPSYLYSQLVTYDLLCCLVLAPIVARTINLLTLSAPILLLGTAGYFWDFFAVKYGWWAFHAVTQIKLWTVPLDEFNFFLFGPTSAISIYLTFCALLRLPQIRPRN